MATTFNNKCAILFNLWIAYKDDNRDEGWTQYVNTYDLSLPLALGFFGEYAKPTQKGKDAINEAWDVACGMLQLDPSDTYASLNDMMDKSPNPKIENV